MGAGTLLASHGEISHIRGDEMKVVRSKRGQVSLEVIMITGLAIILLVSFVNMGLQREAMAEDIGETGEARMIGELLATAINNVYANGNGFSTYIGGDKINFTKIYDFRIMGVVTPINIAPGNITIIKNLSKTGGTTASINISIIPSNISREDPTAEFPEITVRNNGTHIIIYANSTNINVG